MFKEISCGYYNRVDRFDVIVRRLNLINRYNEMMGLHNHVDSRLFMFPYYVNPDHLITRYNEVESHCDDLLTRYNLFFVHHDSSGTVKTGYRLTTDHVLVQIYSREDSPTTSRPLHFHSSCQLFASNGSVQLAMVYRPAPREATVLALFTSMLWWFSCHVPMGRCAPPIW